MKRLFLCLLAGFCWGVSSSSATVPSDYDLVLNIHDYQIVEGVTANKLIAFDYWYAPDSYPEYQGTGTPMVPQNLRIYDSGPVLKLCEYNYFYPSDEWNTTIFEFPYEGYTMPTTHLLFDKPVLTGYAHTETEEAGSRIMDSRIYIKDIRSYASMDDYYADINGGGGGNSDQPVPEPGTFAMLGMSIIGFLGFEIKRRKLVK